MAQTKLKVGDTLYSPVYGAKNVIVRIDTEIIGKIGRVYIYNQNDKIICKKDTLYHEAGMRYSKQWYASEYEIHDNLKCKGNIAEISKILNTYKYGKRVVTLADTEAILKLLQHE
jgi:hypothetical protein